MAVPVAAAAGMLVLGVLAFIVALLMAVLANGDLDFGLEKPEGTIAPPVIAPITCWAPRQLEPGV